METVKYTIIRIGADETAMCRIVPHDIRSLFKNVPGSDGGCCCSLEAVLSTMEQITKGCAKIGFEAIFEYQSDEQHIFTTNITEQAVNDAKARAAESGKDVSVVAHYTDAEDREVIFHPDGSNEKILAIEDERKIWLVGNCCSEYDGVYMERVRATKAEIADYLVGCVDADRANNPDGWEYGTETAEEVTEEEGMLNAYGAYNDYHIDYTAVEEMEPISLRV